MENWRCLSFRITEYAGKSNEELASAFIVSTCRLLPKSSPVLSDHMHDILPSYGPGPKQYSIFCGSVAEFYIRPLNPCIGDTDDLIVKAHALAFNDEFMVLPRDVSGLFDTFECYTLESYQRFPGFVRLRVLGEMKFNWRYKKYEFNHTVHTNAYMYPDMNTMANWYYLSTRVKDTLPNVVTGPAIKVQQKRPTGCFIQSDVVYSIWCPQWPKEAEGWFKRPRNNAWPTIDIISEVVQNGCHVVYVQHRSCRDDKDMWRFSFSFAEVILLQSWTPIQQIVYHLLRFFAKRELIQKDCPKEDEVLCPYHLKTLMLWTCEEMSPEWWNSSSVIAICCELLQKLSEWLRKGHCPNYFIPKTNLFHEPSHSKMLDKTKQRLNEYGNSGILCHWFVENYILPVSRKHVEIKRTMEVIPNFMDYMLPLFEFWKESESKSFDFLFYSALTYAHKNSRSLIKYGFSSGLRQTFKDRYLSRSLQLKTNRALMDLPTIQNVSCFTYYDIMLHILQAAYGIGCGEISWDSKLLVEVVNAISIQPKNVRSEHHHFPKAYTTQILSQFEFLRAQDLMQNLTGSNSRPEFKLVSLMSKEFLRKALEYDDDESNSITLAALAYLAALHFATSEYQTAMRLCFVVLEYQTSEKEKETLNAGCLLFIDDVARIVGLCVLYKKITDNNLHYIDRRLYLDLRLSPEVFAHYIFVLFHQNTSKYFDFYHDLPESAFSMDEYLKTSLKPQCTVSRKSNFNAVRHIVYRRTDSMTEIKSTFVNRLLDNETLVVALMEYALENLTSFYSVIRKDFGIHCNTDDCYRALHLYKCRKYNEVLHLCERILDRTDMQSDLKEFLFANVLVIPLLDSFFDRDVQSLLGFHTLFYYLSPLNDDIGKVALTAQSTFEHFFARLVYYNKCELLFLLKYDSIKCHYFLGRHFLARYLKVRCYIDCNLSYKVAMTEFSIQKTNLPFEHIIRRFLLRKLRIIKK